MIHWQLLQGGDQGRGSGQERGSCTKAERLQGELWEMQPSPLRVCRWLWAEPTRQQPILDLRHPLAKSHGHHPARLTQPRSLLPAQMADPALLRSTREPNTDRGCKSCCCCPQERLWQPSPPSSLSAQCTGPLELGLLCAQMSHGHMSAELVLRHVVRKRSSQPESGLFHSAPR